MTTVSVTEEADGWNKTYVKYVRIVNVIMSSYMYIHTVASYVDILYYNNKVDTHKWIVVPVIVMCAGSLAGPIPNSLTPITMTTTVPVNTLSGSDGAVNVSVVVELLTFTIVPLWYTWYPVISPCVTGWNKYKITVSFHIISQYVI